MDFVNWIESELTKREWTRADLARKGKLTTAQVTRVLNRQQNAGRTFCNGIAKAFNLPVEQVYRNADLLPADPDADPWADEMAYKLSRLNPELRRIAEGIITHLAREEERRSKK